MIVELNCIGLLLYKLFSCSSGVQVEDIASRQILSIWRKYTNTGRTGIGHKDGLALALKTTGESDEWPSSYSVLIVVLAILTCIILIAVCHWKYARFNPEIHDVEPDVMLTSYGSHASAFNSPCSLQVEWVLVRLQNHQRVDSISVYNNFPPIRSIRTNLKRK
ncbi:hypothetical protein EB796_018397 [Bugula neritina]|uniref:Uncharacterized protein n=1 Tax=Bugula neritina TaxID=10212 RepID=A0A7J7JBF0_BUGNE|nr:hypothetical protein EB796_018397 [Bugula neritina]